MKKTFKGMNVPSDLFVEVGSESRVDTFSGASVESSSI